MTGNHGDVSTVEGLQEMWMMPRLFLETFTQNPLMISVGDVLVEKKIEINNTGCTFSPGLRFMEVEILPNLETPNSSSMGPVFHWKPMVLFRESRGVNRNDDAWQYETWEKPAEARPRRREQNAWDEWKGTEYNTWASWLGEKPGKAALPLY